MSTNDQPLGLKIGWFEDRFYFKNADTNQIDSFRVHTSCFGRFFYKVTPQTVENQLLYVNASSYKKCQNRYANTKDIALRALLSLPEQANKEREPIRRDVSIGVTVSAPHAETRAQTSHIAQANIPSSSEEANKEREPIRPAPRAAEVPAPNALSQPSPIAQDRPISQVKIYLPKDKLNNKNSFVGLGIIYSEKETLLPTGWTTKENYVDSDKKNIVIYDETGLPRAEVFVKNAIYDEYFTVRTLSKEEGTQILDKERELVIQAEQTKKELEEVLKLRSEKFSDKHPFGVFLIKDMSELKSMGYTNQDRRFSCHGFFPTQESADRAVALLKKKNPAYNDKAFSSPININKDKERLTKYKLVDFNQDTQAPMEQNWNSKPGCID